MNEYLNFLMDRGRPLSEINPGSEDLAISPEDAYHAISLLSGLQQQVAIAGGDILSTEQGVLSYAYQLWGPEYHYLNWYCDKLDNESDSDYCKRSFEIAQTSIHRAAEEANRLGKECFIVFVVSTDSG